MDAATGINHKGGPTPNDITVCLYCGHIMAFADDLSMRNLTETEMCMIAGNKTIIAIQKARQKVFKKEK